MRILFAGTPDLAVPSLRELVSRHTVCGVLTSPDRKAGRGRKLVPSPAKLAALELDIPVLQPSRLGSVSRQEAASLYPDLLVVFAYGRIFGPKFLSLFPKGGINLHPSLLPKYRGPSPIPATIRAGDRETGISVQQIAPEMDAGDLFEQVPLPLAGTETAESLAAEIATVSAPILCDVVDRIEAGTAVVTPQSEEGVSYCKILTKEDGRIDWSLPSQEIERMVRAFYPWPTAHTTFGDQQVSILEADIREAETSPETPEGTILRLDKREGILVQTGRGVLAVRQLQLQSKKALDFKSFWNGVRGFDGAVLGSRLVR